MTSAEIVKVNVKVHSLVSSLKTHPPTLHFTAPPPLVTGPVPFQLHTEHTVLQPFRRIELIVHIAKSALPGTNFYLSQVKHLRIKCSSSIQCPNILNNSTV